jgi:hypothetical protein
MPCNQSKEIHYSIATMALCNVNRITGTEKGEDEISYLAPESNVDSI